MTKEEFFRLLSKYEQETSTPEETQLLYSYCEAAQQKAFSQTWELSDREETRLRLLKRLNRSVQTMEKQAKRKKRLRYTQIAAAVVVLLGLGWFFSKEQFHKVPAANQITLELEDGSIQILDAQEPFQLTDTQGTVVGKTTNQALRYTTGVQDSTLVYHTLKVPYGKQFSVVLADSSRVLLNAGSSLKYPKSFLAAGTRSVHLTGEAFFEVHKDTRRPFIVHSGALKVAVLGTRFNVQAYAEELATHVVLVEGAVALTAKEQDASDPVLLAPGEMGSYSKEGKVFSKKQVATPVYTSWMQGQLVFRDITFENMLKKLERHYNVKINNTNAKLAQERFNASFGDVPITAVFESLKTYHGINYTLKGDVITIH